MPDTIIYGLVRDQYGLPVQDTTAQVVLISASGAVVTTSIQPELAVGVNYALRVPMDAGSIPTPYVANALTTGAQYQLFVVVNGATNLPMEMVGKTLALGAPTQLILQNLTVGTDANGDGIPDAWEQAFLQSIGVNISLASINPNGVYTKDGRTLMQEYLLGNYPYNPNAFTVTLVSLNAGSALLSFTTTANRTYSVYGSADLQNWTPLSFAVPAVGTQTNSSYYASSAQPLQIQTVQPTNVPRAQFFRVQFQ
jgi:hypothetical protein